MTNDLQRSVIDVAVEYARVSKKPISQKYIVAKLSHQKFPDTTVKAAVRTLVRKGYFRRAITTSAAYVLVRTI